MCLAAHLYSNRPKYFVLFLAPSQVSIRSLCAYFVRQTEPKILRLVWCESSSQYTRLLSQSYTSIETLTISRVVQPVRHISKGRENLAASENFLSACSVWSGVFLVLVFLFLGVISILCRLRHREVCEKSGGGGPMMTKSHPWHSPSHSRHPTHSSNPPDLHTPLLRHQICIG